MRPKRVLLVMAVVAALATGCSSGVGPSAGTAATSASSPSTSSRTAVPATSSAVMNTGGAVAFFRSQEAVCRAHAEKVGNSVVAADRFAGANQVRDLGGGAFLVEDGQGTRLVVKPSEGVVLPESGDPDDEMPSDYSFGCPPDVFLGTVA